MPSDLLDRPWPVQRRPAAGFDGEVAGGAVADFFFVIFDSGPTLELGHQIDLRGPALRLPADVDIFVLAELLFADSGADDGARTNGCRC